MAKPVAPRSPASPRLQTAGLGGAAMAMARPAAGAGTGAGTGFAHPARSSQGSAALAALFDRQEETAPAFGRTAVAEAEPAEWKGIDPMPVDDKIDDILNMPQIARLLGQHEKQEKAAAGAKAPVIPTRTSRPKASAVAANAVAASAARKGVEPARGPLRHAARALAEGLSRLGDITEGILAALLARGQGDDAEVATPGDRKVTEWRLEQLRRARRRMTPSKMLGWVGLSATFAVAVYAMVFLREDISAHWPQAARAYAAIGAGPELEPVSISSISHRYARSPQGPVVELTGFVSHGGDEPLRAPLIRADALAADGALLASWAFALDGVSRIMPQSETPFRTRALMPDGAARVRVSLMGAEERADLEQKLPEAITALESGAGSNAFFMRKTTSGWGGGDEPAPIKSAEN